MFKYFEREVEFTTSDPKDIKKQMNEMKKTEKLAKNTATPVSSSFSFVKIGGKIIISWKVWAGGCVTYLFYNFF